jgi:hypothetical protein
VGPLYFFRCHDQLSLSAEKLMIQGVVFRNTTLFFSERRHLLAHLHLFEYVVAIKP